MNKFQCILNNTGTIILSTKEKPSRNVLAKIGQPKPIIKNEIEDFKMKNGISPRTPTNNIDITYPITPSNALNVFSEKLSDYEKGEILNYRNVYFVAENIGKKIYDNNGPNNGYDDKKGNYKLVAHDHIAYRYEIIKILGKGSFGQTVKCYDYKRKLTVAIKIIKNNEKYHKQAGIESDILKYINKNDPKNKSSIVRMYESFMFRNHFVVFIIF